MHAASIGWLLPALVHAQTNLDGPLSVAELAATVDRSPSHFARRHSVFVTNPNAYVVGTEQLFVSCSWITDRGSVDLLAIVDDIDVLTQVVIVEGDRVAFSFAEPALTEESFDATYELVDPMLGETVGTAVADADLAPTRDRITDVERVDPHRLSVIGRRLAVDGTLSITLGGTTTQLAMDDESCEAGDVRVQVMEKIARQ